MKYPCSVCSQLTSIIDPEGDYTCRRCKWKSKDHPVVIDPKQKDLNWNSDIVIGDYFLYEGNRIRVERTGWAEDTGSYVKLEGIRKRIYEGDA